jgi:hypothetical protein
MKWAIELAPPMPAQLVATLAGLANHADPKGRGAYPSLAKLAAYTCKSERSVRRDLRQLEELKLIRPGDPAKVAHLPVDKRPEVYDLAMERTVPGGRAGDDEGTRASARTLASSRERGRAARAAKKATSDTGSPPEREDVDVRGDVGDRPDVDVTTGGTWTSQRADVDVTTGGTPTSAKPSFEPPTNRQMNRGELALVHNAPAATADAWPEGPPAPIDIDGFTVTDSMRRWANDVYPQFDTRFSTQQFIRHYRSTGTRRPNWPEAWRKWIAEDAERGSRRQTRGAPRHQQETDDWFERSMARARARDAAAEGGTA